MKKTSWAFYNRKEMTVITKGGEGTGEGNNSWSSVRGIMKQVKQSLLLSTRVIFF